MHTSCRFVENCDLESALMIIEESETKGVNLNVPNRDGRSPLFMACLIRYAPMIDLILTRFDVTTSIAATDKRGWTPMHAGLNSY